MRLPPRLASCATDRAHQRARHLRRAAGHAGVTALLTGGRLDERTGSLVGPLACRAASQFAVHTFFASAAAVDARTGAMESDARRSGGQAQPGGQRDRVVLGVDASKLAARGVAVGLDWDHIDVLVTELEPSTSGWRRSGRRRDRMSQTPTQPVAWTASMISPIDDFDGAPILRRELDLDVGHGDVASAVLHVSSLGIFEASLNGEPVDDDVLSPGWSSYEWRLRYRSYDVTALVRPHTVIEVALGNGWYRGRLGWTRHVGDLRRSARAHRAAGDHVRRRPPTARRDGRTMDGAPVGDDRQRPLRRPDDRRSPSGRQRRRGRCRGHRLRHRSSDAVRRTSGSAAGDDSPGPDLDVAVRTHARRLRPEPRRLASSPRAWRRGLDDHRATRRGPRARRARCPPAAHREGDRSVHPQRRRRRLRADDDVPRLPLRRGRRLSRGARPPPRSRRSSCTPTSSGSGTSRARTTC